MFSPYSKTRVNYTAILTTLIQVTNESWNDYQKRQLTLDAINGLDNVDLIRKYRTVGVKVAYGCGIGKVVEGLVKIESGPILEICKDKKILTHKDSKVLLIDDLRFTLEESGEIKFDVNFIEDCNLIVVHDADITLNRMGITQFGFNRWVYQTFGTQVIVIHLN